MTIGSLASGYGGLDLAIALFFDAQVRWFCECEAAPSKVLAAHWPGVPNHGDMTAVDWSTVEPVDIIAGGTPCQDLSNAGRRAGMTEGTRSNLWVQMREAIAAIRPRFVIWENVRGALSAYASSEVESESGLLGGYGSRRPALRALGRVLGDLADLGYDTGWCGLRAADAGAPHGRFRVFVLAYTSGIRGRRWAAQLGATGRNDASVRSGSGDVASDTVRGGRSGWSCVSGRESGGRALAGGAGTRGVADAKGGRWDELASTPACREHVAADAGGRQFARVATARDGLPITAERRGVAPADTGRSRLGKLAGGAPAEEAGSAGGDEPASARRSRPTQDWGPYRAAIGRWEQTIGRAAPAPTESGKHDRRRLSPRFVEWMMGLPEGWVTSPTIGLSRNEQLKALGNGVVPQQAMLALSLLSPRVRLRVEKEVVL